MAPLVGYWGERTALIDWCEANYMVSFYIAEFWNTLSSLWFIYPPLIASCKLWRMNVEKEYIISLVFVSITGCGSFMFHASLRYPYQLWDELAMMWSVLYVLYLSFKILKPSQAEAKKFVPLMAAYGIVCSSLYLIFKFPLIYQLSFGAVTYYAVYHGYLVSRTLPCSPRLFYGALVAQNFGFVLWLIDQNLCPSLESWRGSLPAFLAPLSQLHALWHMITGYACYCLILFCIHVRLLSQRRQFNVTFDIWTWGVMISEQTSAIELNDVRCKDL